jgi:hypothetical protein
MQPFSQHCHERANSQAASCPIGRDLRSRRVPNARTGSLHRRPDRAVSLEAFAGSPIWERRNWAADRKCRDDDAILSTYTTVLLLIVGAPARRAATHTPSRSSSWSTRRGGCDHRRWVGRTDFSPPVFRCCCGSFRSSSRCWRVEPLVADAQHRILEDTPPRCTGWMPRSIPGSTRCWGLIRLTPRNFNR